VPADRSPVPTWLRGCWRRAWIEFADGSRDDATSVHWLQTDVAMADVRLGADRPSFAGVRSFAEAGPEQLAALSTANASTGFTSVADVRRHPDGSHTCTAEWHTYGHGVNFRPECEFPEPGHLHVDAAGTTMIERAPSGAYVEEWRLVPGSQNELRHAVDDDGTELFVAGPIAIVVRDRRPDPARRRDTTVDLLDCEFSVATRGDDDVHRIVASTLPWREGEVVDVGA
jgi:hypothetical protein